MGALLTDRLERTHEREQELVREMREKHVFQDVPEEELVQVIAASTEMSYPSGVTLATETEQLDRLLILLEGYVRISRQGPNGQEIFWKKIAAPNFIGEISLLSNQRNPMKVVSLTEMRGLSLPEEDFWRLMSVCHHWRAAVLAQMRFRITGLQAAAVQQEKLATLGTLTAGLMHELNNPGAAASRAASQLRTNLNRMHEMARSFDAFKQEPAQKDCIHALQERILKTDGTVCLSSIEQSDAEEALVEWMEARSIPKAWEMAPMLANSGILDSDLDCLGHVFTGEGLAKAVEWLSAIASSVQMTELVEHSVSRVAELAHAVKSYAHEGQGGTQDLDVNESIHSTLVMLKHKFREKNITLEKDFGAGLQPLRCVCSGLNQVWTNLLDNAIDAVGREGRIRVRTWREGADTLVSIGDNGPGIPTEDQDRIFDPFFTTKPAGIGTGLGLGIVERVLEGFEATLTFHSKPGDTEFLVRIPNQAA